jgi:NADPH-dependent 2,4-dienoyl-CoA reductase/sulfur reductase-like enzyme
MKHVILGAGPAGVIAAETLRKHAPADEITVVGDEPEAPYSRMAIPYLLMGNVGEPAPTCATARPLRAQRITLLNAAAPPRWTRRSAWSRSKTAASCPSTAC